jgi:rhodanese-related sulfurtransferase
VVSTIGTDELRRALEGPVQLLEALGADDFAEEHLPGATNVPLAELDPDRAATLDPATTTVVYGFDHECDLAPRAAARLERLGFSDVRVYRPGKAGWLAAGLPGEGRRRAEQRVAAIASADVPRIPAGATVGDATGLLGAADVGVVQTDDDVVLGVLRPEVAGLDPATPVADVLQPGPSTFRPSMTVRELVDYFRSSDEQRALVTDHAGRWIGLIRRTDVLDG